MRFRFVILFALIALLTMSICVAEEDLRFQIQQIDVDDNGDICVTVLDPRMENLQGKDYHVSLDQNELKVSSVSSLETEGIETNWLFIVDASEFVGERRIAAMNATLNGMIFGNGIKAAMGKNDKAAIIPTGTVIGSIEPTSDKEVLKKQIEALQRDTKANALFAEIDTVLSYVNREKDYKKRFVIVVLSTGQNETDVGATYEKVRTGIENTNVTLYTFAFLRGQDSFNRTAVDRYKSLARASRGGIGVELPAGEKDVGNQVNLVIGNEIRFRCLLLNPVEVKATGERLNVSDNENARYNDTMILTERQKGIIDERIRSVIAAETTPTPSPSPSPSLAPTPEPTPTAIPESTATPVVTSIPEPQKEKTFLGMSPVMLGGIGGGILVVVILIGIIVSKKKKNQEEFESVEDYGSSQSQSDSGTVTGLYTDLGKTEASNESEKSVPSVPSIIVRLESVGLNEKAVYESPMVDELVIGRVPNLSRLIIKGDPKISGANSKLTYENGTMCIEDMNSRNGTRVNGMDIKGKVVLHQQDTIGMGLTNLRISWSKQK